MLSRYVHGVSYLKGEGAAPGESNLDGNSLVLQFPPNNVRWAKKQYGVILPKVPEIGRETCPAVVGLSNRPVNGVYWFEHLCLA
jgi:hypothetical protein